jgi:hypothetical protein
VILDNEPFSAVRIIGIEAKPGYATFDLLLLLALFWNRIILRSLGLWDSKPIIEEPTMNRISGCEISIFEKDFLLLFFF